VRSKLVSAITVTLLGMVFVNGCSGNEASLVDPTNSASSSRVPSSTVATTTTLPPVLTTLPAEQEDSTGLWFVEETTDPMTDEIEVLAALKATDVYGDYMWQLPHFMITCTYSADAAGYITHFLDVQDPVYAVSGGLESLIFARFDDSEQESFFAAVEDRSILFITAGSSRATLKYEINAWEDIDVVFAAGQEEWLSLLNGVERLRIKIWDRSGDDSGSIFEFNPTGIDAVLPRFQRCLSPEFFDSSTTTSSLPNTTLAPTTSAAPTTTTDPEPTVPQTTSQPGLSHLHLLTGQYPWGFGGEQTRELQEALGLDADGVYGPQTRAAHLAELERRALPTSGVPAPPTEATVPTTTVAPSPGSTSTEPPTTTTVPAAPEPTVDFNYGLVSEILGNSCAEDGDLTDCPEWVMEWINEVFIPMSTAS